MKRNGPILLAVFIAILFAIVWKTRPHAPAQTEAPDGRRGKREAAAKEAKAGRFEEHPNEHGERIDKSFIGPVLGEQLVPMLNACYQEMHARRPDAGSGLVKVWFKIVAAEQLFGSDDRDAK